MKLKAVGSTKGSSTSKYTRVPGLRSGKIQTIRGSAAGIFRTIGVTRADERLADRALTVATTKPERKDAAKKAGGTLRKYIGSKTGTKVAAAAKVSAKKPAPKAGKRTAIKWD